MELEDIHFKRLKIWYILRTVRKNGGFQMKIIQLEQDFSKVEADVLVIGVPEHPENTEGWEGFVTSFSIRLPEWLKSGDIKTDFKKIVKMPSINELGYKRVLFVGLGSKKKLNENRLREVFAAVGKELAAMKASFRGYLDSPVHK